MIFDGGRWDRIRSWGYYWLWERGGWRLRIDMALYTVPLPSLYLCANAPTVEATGASEHSVTVGASVGTRGLSDPPLAVEATVPVPYGPWRWLDWLAPDELAGKRWCRGWNGERWPWAAGTR